MGCMAIRCAFLSPETKLKSEMKKNKLLRNAMYYICAVSKRFLLFLSLIFHKLSMKPKTRKEKFYINILSIYRILKLRCGLVFRRLFRPEIWLVASRYASIDCHINLLQRATELRQKGYSVHIKLV